MKLAETIMLPKNPMPVSMFEVMNDGIRFTSHDMAISSLLLEKVCPCPVTEDIL
jgi:hypothetical protein